MTPRRPGDNPYRPYYIPPSIEEPLEHPLPKPDPHAFFAHHHAAAGNGSGTNYASRARDIFSDLDYKDYIAEPSPSVVRSAKALIDDLLWRYTSVLMAQPFEVAKTILQVRLQDDPGALGPNRLSETGAEEEEQTTMPRHVRRSIARHDDEGYSDSDPDEPAYFTSNMPGTSAPCARPTHRRHTIPSRSPSPPSPRPKPSSVPAHQLDLRASNSVLEVIAQLWQKEGAWGVWKGSNATFVYSVLQSLLENWSRSLLSALFNVPDLGMRDDVDKLIDVASPYPWASFFVAAAAAVSTGLILAPLDLVRTRLVLTPTSRQPRGTLSTLVRLPSFLPAPSLLLPTALHALIHPTLTLSTPLVLRTHFHINRDLAPLTFSAARFASACAALFVKLPLECVLRRGQAALLATPAYVRALETRRDGGVPARPVVRGGKLVVTGLAADAEGGRFETVVPVGVFRGTVGTMLAVVGEEGSRPARNRSTTTTAKKGARKPQQQQKGRVAETVYRRGQGLGGLWRGWKVSWWGLVGLWAAGVAGGGGNGEF